MKIEHITLGGNAVIRDSATILPTTRRVFDAISMAYDNQVVHIPKLPFQIKITAADEGALFDIQKKGNPVILNVCCFNSENADIMLNYVSGIAENFANAGIPFDVIVPVTPTWLYSIIIDPYALPPADITLAGEVELYIYQQLHNAYVRSRQQ